MFNLQQIKGLILDMDGVLWRGSVPIGDLVKNFARIKQLGIKVTLATNNSGFTVMLLFYSHPFYCFRGVREP